MASNPIETSLFAALEALPDGLTGEIVDGQLHATPRPAPAHALVSSSLGGELHSPFQRGRGGPGGWWILDEPEIHFIRRIELTVPDLTGWRRERLPRMPSTAFFELVPDWVCEIASPSTARQAARLCAARRAVRLVDRSARTLARGARAGGRRVRDGPLHRG